MKRLMVLTVLCISFLAAMDDKPIDEETKAEWAQLVAKVNQGCSVKKDAENQQAQQQIEQHEEGCQICQDITKMGFSYSCWQHTAYEPSPFSRDSN